MKAVGAGTLEHCSDKGAAVWYSGSTEEVQLVQVYTN